MPLRLRPLLGGQIVNMGSIEWWIGYLVVFQVNGDIEKLPGHGAPPYWLFNGLRIDWRPGAPGYDERGRTEEKFINAIFGTVFH